MKLIHELFVAQGVADAFGYKVEFVSLPIIKGQYGENGLTFKDVEGGKLIASDDTQMSLFTLEGLLDFKDGLYPSVNDAVLNAYKRWLTTQKDSVSLFLEKQNPNYIEHSKYGIEEFKEMCVRRAPGITCLQALKSPIKGTVTNKINDSKGCGGVMRTLPAIYFANSEDEAFKYGCDFAAITHGHPSGFYSAGAYNVIGYHLLHEKDVDFAINSAKKFLVGEEAKETLDFLNHAELLLKNNTFIDGDDLVNQLGLGNVGESAMAIAIYTGLQKDISYEKMVEWSTNHSGDSDSTAMMAAGLWYLNKENTNKDFLKYEEQLDLKNVISNLSTRYERQMIKKPSRKAFKL